MVNQVDKSLDQQSNRRWGEEGREGEGGEGRGKETEMERKKEREKEQAEDPRKSRRPLEDAGKTHIPRS